MINYFVFDGESSLDYGVYIGGQDTYNAPQRDVTKVGIPGRNGDLIQDNGRFLNVQVPYHIVVMDEFRDKTDAIKAWLLSKKGYCKLVDTYHPETYRMARVQGGIDFQTGAYNLHGKTKIIFDCKPQRWLDSGEEEFNVGEWGTTETVSGSLVTINNPGNKLIKSLGAGVEYTQDLNGYTKPWPGGVGKNILPPVSSEWEPGFLNTTGGISAAHSVRLEKTSPFFPVTAGTEYVFSVDLPDHIPDTSWVAVCFYDSTQTFVGNRSARSRDYIPATAPEGAAFARTSFRTFGLEPNVQMEAGSEVTAFEPYANICPIVGKTGLTVYVSPTTEPTGATAYPVTWQTEAGEVYMGEVDVVSGALTVTHEIWVLDGTQTYTQNSADIIAVTNENKYKVDQTPKSSQFDGIAPGSSSGLRAGQFRLSANLNSVNFRFGAEKTVAEWTEELAANPVQVLMQLATPVTYKIAPQQVELLDGTNNIWSDAGGVTVEYGDNPGAIENPTLFDSLPMIHIEGNGSGVVTVGNASISISNLAGYVDIDCELKLCYKGGENMSQYISMTDHKFPVLKPGNNNIAFGGGITGVTIKGRWWTI